MAPRGQPLIVVGVDGPSASKEALRWAAGQAQLTGAELRVVTAWRLPVTYGYAPDYSGAGYQDRARETLDDAIGQVLGPTPPLSVDARVEEGDPAQVLLSAAREADADDRVAGMVPEPDLLAKVAVGSSGHRPGPLVRLRERREHDKARGETAADLMTSPAITVLPSATVAEAAWLAALSRLKRLPVADHDGRLVGVVRRDALLQALIRDDAGIQKVIEAKILTFCSPASRDSVAVQVHDGVVELSGRMSNATMARLAAQIENIDGVVEVNNRLTSV
ncbi:hypothetical protein SHL15_1181 [Streptomyces hygroscopicus subsp. limoneus]|nr:hypothetical protein SHL15_1181 [Streptomyces hygroscopicus subsp. limoneus]